MKVHIAKPTGWCFGVKRAIRSMEQALAQEGRVYCIGSPIHNPQEVRRLERLGLTVVSDPADVPSRSTVFIRAHGVAPSVMDYLQSIDAKVIDGTCPFVRTAQKRAQELSQAGYHVVIVGDGKHPEVLSILGHVQGPWTVVANSTEMEKLGRIGRIGILSQTTQQERILAEVVAVALAKSQETRVFNTICRATVDRQKAVAALAAETDGIILIGGRNSANTGKLCRIAQELDREVQWIEEAEELDRGWLENKSNIGIAAGASTPDWLIAQLYNAIPKGIVGRQGDVRS